MKFRAAVLYELNRPLQVEEITLPSVAAGQVLVRLAYSGVCHSQLMEARGKRGSDPYLPHLLGHEGSGTVVEAGKGVTKVKPGDRVILGWIKSLGMSVPGPKYLKNGMTISAGGVTTFNEYAIVSEDRCVKLPKGVPMDCAVLFGCAIPTGAGMVMHQIRPEKGSTVAVFGLGGVGLSALMALCLYDCSSIIAIDVVGKKLELALNFGATHLVNAAATDPAREIAGITEGKGVDYSIETTGSAASIELAFQSVRKFGGRCVFASHPETGDTISLDPYEMICGKKIEGSWGGASNPDKDIPKLARLYREGMMPLEKLLSHRYKLDEINQALDMLESKQALRVLITFDHNDQTGG
jgi:S-(hydroxymethyl)glutathione dehydrogenase/alcohol dehydrogenase